jgi:hypothetical protein
MTWIIILKYFIIDSFILHDGLFTRGHIRWYARAQIRPDKVIRIAQNETKSDEKYNPDTQKTASAT